MSSVGGHRALHADDFSHTSTHPSSLVVGSNNVTCFLLRIAPVPDFPGALIVDPSTPTVSTTGAAGVFPVNKDDS